MSIGIDFGAFSSRIGSFNQTGFRVISNFNQKSTTPSVAYLKSKGDWIFGESAIKFSARNPEQYIYESKLLLGHKFNDEFIQNKRNSWAFKMKNGENGNIKIIIIVDGETQEFFPYEIVGFILKNLVNISYSSLPEKIYHTVLSIPATFNEYQKKDFHNAAKSANFQNVHFVIEPILASIAYMYNMQADLSEDRNILVYSLGFYNLEVTLIQIQNGKSKITIEGDEKINGHQFDENIFSFINEKMEEKYPNRKSYLEKPKTQSKLRMACQQAKSLFSGSDSVDISIKDEENEINDGSIDSYDEEESNNLIITLTTEKFIDINKDLFENSMNSVKTVFDRAQIDPKSVDELFVVGGLTFMPLIREKLKNVTGKDPSTSADPSEAPVLGACIMGAYYSMNEIANDDSFQINFEFLEKLKILDNFSIDYQLVPTPFNDFDCIVVKASEKKCCNCCKCLLV